MLNKTIVADTLFIEEKKKLSYFIVVKSSSWYWGHLAQKYKVGNILIDCLCILDPDPWRYACSLTMAHGDIHGVMVLLLIIF